MSECSKASIAASQLAGMAADYDEPLALAEGIDDVLVAGVPVLAGGRLTGALPGAGLRARR